MKSKQFLIIVSLFIAVFTAGADSFIISPLLPEISKEFSSTITQTAYGVTIYALCYAFGAPIFGPLGDKYSKRKLIISGLILFLIGTLLCGTAPNLILFYIYRAIAALGVALFLPNIWAFIGTYFKGKTLNKVMGIVMSALSLSIAIGVPLGSFLSQISDWHMVFFASTFLTLLALILLIINLPETSVNVHTNTSYFDNFWTVMKTKNALPALLITLFWMFGFYSIYTFLGTSVSETFNFNTTQVGEVFIVYGASNFIASFFGGTFMNKIGHKASVILNGSLSIIFVLVVGFSGHNLVMLIISLILLAFSQGLGVTALTAYIVNVVPDNRSTVMAFNSSFLYLGLVAGSAIGGLLFQNFGFPRVSLFAGIGLFIAIFIAMRLKKKEN